MRASVKIESVQFRRNRASDGHSLVTGGEIRLVLDLDRDAIRALTSSSSFKERGLIETLVRVLQSELDTAPIDSGRQSAYIHNPCLSG